MRNKMAKAGMLAGVLVLSGMEFYYVREMLAALLLFSMAFAIIAAMILILFLLDRGLYCALVWAGPYTAHGGLRLHRSWVQFEQFGRKQFHRSEQPVDKL